MSKAFREGYSIAYSELQELKGPSPAMFDRWLNDVISDGGHTVEQYISYCEHDFVRVTGPCEICSKCRDTNPEAR